MPHPDPIARIRDLVAFYDRGTYTAQEVAGAVVASIDASNVSEILRTLPGPVRSVVAQRAAEAPRTEEDWSRLELVSFSAGTTSIPANRTSIELLRRRLEAGDLLG